MSLPAEPRKRCRDVRRAKASATGLPRPPLLGSRARSQPTPRAPMAFNPNFNNNYNRGYNSGGGGGGGGYGNRNQQYNQNDQGGRKRGRGASPLALGRSRS